MIPEIPEEEAFRNVLLKPKQAGAEAQKQEKRLRKRAGDVEAMVDGTARAQAVLKQTGVSWLWSWGYTWSGRGRGAKK